MFIYQKKLQYPVRIKNTNPKLAAQIITQYGGPKCHRVQKHSLGFQWKPRLCFHFICCSIQASKSS